MEGDSEHAHGCVVDRTSGKCEFKVVIQPLVAVFRGLKRHLGERQCLDEDT